MFSVHLDQTPTHIPQVDEKKHTLSSRCNEFSVQRIKDCCIHWITLPFSSVKYALLKFTAAPAAAADTQPATKQTSAEATSCKPSECAPKAVQIAKFPTALPKAISFKDLECTPADVQKITRLISTLGEKNKLALWKCKNDLNQLGQEIAHVHPLKTFSIALSDPYLKSCMQKIRADRIKWSHFMSKNDGFAKAFTDQDQKGKITIFLNDFAKTVGVTPESIQGFAKNQEWSEMITFIINH